MPVVLCTAEPFEMTLPNWKWPYLLTRLGFHPTDRAGVYGGNDHPLLAAMQAR